jgi:hypothetical protein
MFAELRDVNTGNLIGPGPSPFTRIPTIGEYIWWGNLLLQVLAVNHTWDNAGQPIVILDVGAAAMQRGQSPSTTGVPQ